MVELFGDLHVVLVEGALDRSCNDIEIGEYGGEPGFLLTFGVVRSVLLLKS